MSSPILITIPDAQKSLSLSRSTIYELLAAKKLDAVKVGRRRLIVQDSISRLVETLTAEAA